MHVIVLGSAAGGGVPQWNCLCDNCNAARRREGVKPRTQDAIAVSADGASWFLLNASSDISCQIARHPVLQPLTFRSQVREARRSPITGVVLTNGDLDHCLGLLSLREWTPFSLYSTGHTYCGLFEHNAMFRTLSRQSRHAVRRQLELDEKVRLLDAQGTPSGLLVRAFSVAGKVPLHLEGLISPDLEMNVGLVVEDQTGKSLAYVPGAGSLAGVAENVCGVDCLLFDGTFWNDDELVRLGLSGRTAQALAHVPIDGPEGSLEALRQVSVAERVYVHLNNTNPILRQGSAERNRVESLGFTVAEDGLELHL